MKVNITSLKLKRQSENAFSIEILSDEHLSPTSFYINVHEARFFADCLRGNAGFYPWFDDITEIARPHSQGMYTRRFDGDKFKEYNFIFPGQKLAEHIDIMADLLESNKPFEQILSQDAFVINLTDLIPAWKEEYAPFVTVIYGVGVEERLAQDVVHPLVKNKEYAKGFVQDRINMAESYSDGEEVQLNIIFDAGEPRSSEKPCSYYWWIIGPNNERYYNGGFIAHGPYEDKKGNQYYEYSVHT